MKKAIIQIIIFISILAVLFFLFKKGVFRNFLNAKTQREAFLDKLKSIDEAAAASWMLAGDVALNTPVNIPAVYHERATFNQYTQATGLSFSVIPGRRVKIEINNTGNRKIFVDLFEKDTSGVKSIVDADTTRAILQTESIGGGNYIVRLQPQPGYEGSYEFTLRTEPLISWPVKQDVQSGIGSYWGADRDGGRRSHQGVDIFASKGSLLVAAADGITHRVGENNLGGKVIFLRPDGLPVSLYYAHLDSQFVTSGTSVKAGDIIGTVGNTGNARNTPPHLHFGVYARGGAVDPIGFIQKEVQPKKNKVTLPIVQKKKLERLVKAYNLPNAKSPFQNIAKGDSIFVIGVTAGFYRIRTSANRQGYIQSEHF